MWKEHFKNLFGNSPKVTSKPITKIINYQLGIKQGQFTREEFNVVLTKIKNTKTTGLDEISPEVWKTIKFNAVYNQNTRMINKMFHPPFP